MLWMGQSIVNQESVNLSLLTSHFVLEILQTLSELYTVHSEIIQALEFEYHETGSFLMSIFFKQQGLFDFLQWASISLVVQIRFFRGVSNGYLVRPTNE